GTGTPLGLLDTSTVNGLPVLPEMIEVGGVWKATWASSTVMSKNTKLGEKLPLALAWPFCWSQGPSPGRYTSKLMFHVPRMLAGRYTPTGPRSRVETPLGSVSKPPGPQLLPKNCGVIIGAETTQVTNIP